MTLPAAPRAADHSSVASRFTRTTGHPPRAPLPVHRSLAHGACWEWQLTIPLGGAEEPGERASVVLGPGVRDGPQGPRVDGRQADPPQAVRGHGIIVGPFNPHIAQVQVVAGLGLHVLHVLLAEQTR